MAQTLGLEIQAYDIDSLSEIELLSVMETLSHIATNSQASQYYYSLNSLNKKMQSDAEKLI